MSHFSLLGTSYPNLLNDSDKVWKFINPMVDLDEILHTGKATKKSVVK